MDTVTAEQALADLTSEGYAEADVRDAIDRLIDAGLEIDQQPDSGWLLTEDEVTVLRRQVGPDGDDIRKALRGADIDFEVQHPRTEAESFWVGSNVPHGDESGAWFGSNDGGIDVSWHGYGRDGGETSHDWYRGTDELVAALQRFLAR